MQIIWIGVSHDSDVTPWSKEYILDDILGGTKKDVIFIPSNGNLDVFIDNSLLVYSSDDRVLDPKLLNYFNEYSARGLKFNLLHMSNEQLNHDDSYYQKANKVLRCYLDWKERPNVINFPIGYKSGFRRTDRSILPLKQKVYNANFIGQVKRDRSDLVSVLNTTPNNFIHFTYKWDCPTQLSASKMSEIMRQSVVTPIPMGNCHIETHRMYEALEAGSIPVLRSYNIWGSYYDDLLGINPLPVINYWDFLPYQIEEVKNDFDRLSQRVEDWYQEIKQSLRDKIACLY